MFTNTECHIFVTWFIFSLIKFIDNKIANILIKITLLIRDNVYYLSEY